MSVATAFGQDTDVRMRLQNRRDIYLLEKNQEQASAFQAIRVRREAMAYA